MNPAGTDSHSVPGRTTDGRRANGNRTSRSDASGLSSYAYDQANQLTSYTSAAQNSINQSIAHRVARTIADDHAEAKLIIKL